MTPNDSFERPGDPDFMASLAKGLGVMRFVAEAESPITIAMASRHTGLSRASVGRCLHTLSALGFVRRTARGYAVGREAISLGHPHLSLTGLAARAQGLLDNLRDELGESCSLGVIEDDELLYIARAEAVRIMAINLRVGSRLPLHATSMGRVLLAGQSEEAQQDYLARTARQRFTSYTRVGKAELLSELRKVRAQGYAIVDEELELGLRSIAVPVTNGRTVVAALNLGTSTARMDVDTLRDDVLRALRREAAVLSS